MPKVVPIPLGDVREGCALLIDRIRRHAASAKLLAASGQLEGSLVFVLLGFEESGKLLYLIRSASRAEAQGGDMLESAWEDLADHGRKAALTSEYIGRVVSLIAWAIRTANITDESLGGYLDHLTAVGSGYMEMRSSVMFVDYRDGGWTRGRPVSQEYVNMDIGSLEVFTVIVADALDRHSTFSELVTTFEKLDKELREGLPRMISEFLKRFGGRQGSEG